MTKVLITGGAGFFGIHLTMKLLAKGQDVIIYDVQRPLKEFQDKVEYVEGDIRDQEKLEKALKGVDIVYHSAAALPSSGNRKTFWEANVKGTESAGKAVLNCGTKRFVYVSSSSVYDLNAGMPLTEESPTIKDGVDYEATKSQGELKVQELMGKGLPATIIRTRTIVGPHRGSTFYMLFDWVRRGKRVYIIGKGDNKFQMISASDLSNACISAAESDKAVGEVFNVGTDRYGTLKEAWSKLIQHAGTGARVVPLPVTLAQIPLRVLYYTGLSPIVPYHYTHMHRDFYLDITKIKRVLGWEPKYSNEEMLIESYDWFIKHLDEFEVGSYHTQAPDQKFLRWLRKIS